MTATIAAKNKRMKKYILFSAAVVILGVIITLGFFFSRNTGENKSGAEIQSPAVLDGVRNVKNKDETKEFLNKVLEDVHRTREGQVGADMMRQIEKYAYLGSIDHLWMDHIDHIDDLREGVELRAYGQRDPLVEFKNEAYSLFENLVIRINEELSRRLFRIGIGVPQPEIPLSQARENIDKSDMTGVVEPKKKIGRNDPCPCGSGKKYKHCHYPQYG